MDLPKPLFDLRNRGTCFRHSQYLRTTLVISAPVRLLSEQVVTRVVSVMIRVLRPQTVRADDNFPIIASI
jgi:hypothetical protein